MTLDQPLLPWQQGTPPVHCVGVDPGKTRCGWAHLVAGSYSGAAHVLGLGQVDAHGDAIRAVLTECLMKVKAQGGGDVCVAVEDQWVPDLASTPPATAGNMMHGIIGVAVARGRWLAFAEARGWQSVSLHPSTWRAVLGGRRGVKRRTMKARALEAVKVRQDSLFRHVELPKRMSDHVAESVLIAEYQLRQMQLAALGGDACQAGNPTARRSSRTRSSKRKRGR